MKTHHNKKALIKATCKKSTTDISKVLLCLVGVCMLFGVHSQELYAQEDSLDDLFLDESFTDDDSGAETNENIIDPDQEVNEESTEDTSQEEFSVDASTPSTIFLGFSIEERLYYTPLQRKEVSLNKDALVFVPQLKNTLMFNNFVQYRNFERGFKFYMDYRLLFTLEDEEWDEKNDVLNVDTFVDTFFNYELNEAFVDFVISDMLTLKVGKSQFRSGSAFLVNPSNPLVFKPGESTAWVRQLNIPDYYSNKVFPQFDFPKGSKEEIGAWQLSTSLDIPLLFFEFGYLPKIESGFTEFDRSHHSFIAKVSYTQWYSVVPSLVYFYDDSSFIGADVSATLSDDITAHAEAGISFKNELRRIQKDALLTVGPNTFFDTYTIQQEKEQGIFLEAIVGISYTLSIDSISYVTILFETYYNGKGLNNDDWKSYLDDLDSLHKDIENASNPLASGNRGLVGNALRLYDPLRVRPLYLMLRLNRDDVFSQFSSETFNVDSVLIYSPFDTSFLWTNGFEWVAVEVLSVGAELHYHFGLEGGAFTELSDVFTLQLYTKFSF